MSSYVQAEETRALSETLSMAVIEIVALHDEMSDLCASIAGQFPATFERIPKYQEAYDALAALEDAKAILNEPMNHVAPSDRHKPVTSMVGRQTRQGRVTSQRVRLGNAVVRLTAVLAAMEPSPPDGFDDDLAGIIADLEAVTFPQRFG